MLGNVTLMEFLGGLKAVAHHRPFPRYVIDERGWKELIHQLSVSDWSLLGIWGDGSEVHAAFRDDEEEPEAVAVVTLPCPDRKFPTLSEVRPGAIRLERSLRDLWGITPVGLTDDRPWLDHGRAPTAPLSLHKGPKPEQPHQYVFLPVEGVALHQIPVGPVHAGIIEPGHFRFTCAGETVVRLEERLGYTHKGVEGLMTGKPIMEAAKVAARISGDSTVAYSLAFARAVEAASGQEAPPRAHWIRALMAEMERIANHLLDIGAICNDAAFAFMLAEMVTLRERLLQAAKSCFGHRLMMDRIIPGGVAADLTREGAYSIRALLAELRRDFERLVDLYDDQPSLQDRTVGTGIVKSELVHRYGAGGFIARASSRAGDARLSPSYAPYDQLDLTTPLLQAGDVSARLWVRIEEVRASLSLIEQILDGIPGGHHLNPIPARGGEGMALVEAFRGEILLWLRLSEVGKVVRCHPRDPSWFQWPLLEAAIEGNIVADFPLCNKSFNCSYSGVDL